MTHTAWPKVPLGELCDVVSGGTPARSDPANFGGGVPWVKIGDLHQGTVTTTEETISETGLERSPAKVLPAGTVLLSIFATIGRTAVLGIEAATNQAIAGVTPRRHNLDRSYLRRFLDHAAEPLARQGRGVAQANINLSILRSLAVPLPPVEEQRRIAAVLDAVDELRAKRRESLALLDSLTESIFLDYFGRAGQVPVSLVTEVSDLPSGWTWEPLVNIAQLATGHTPDREVAAYWDGDIPWISLTEIRRLDGTVARDTELRVTQAGIDNSSSVVLPPGTVCFSRTASIGFVTVMGRPMATSQDFVNWVCGSRLRPTYLMHAFLRSRGQLRAISAGSTHKTIYMRVAEQFHVLVPPVVLQDQFAAHVEQIAEQKSLIAEGSRALDSLFASLQHRAFRGEL